jgi:hypothetical protein
MIPIFNAVVGRFVPRCENFFAWRSAYLTVVMALFCISFYFPLSSKGINNFFYVAIALPCFFWAFAKPRALWRLLVRFSWFFAPLLLLVVLKAVDFQGLKKWLYLLMLFLACVFVGFSRRGTVSFYTLFALASCAVLLWALVEWLLLWAQGGGLIRYGVFLGDKINPVYFSLLIGGALIFLWLFHVEAWLESRSRLAYFSGLSIVLALLLLCSVVFQSRTNLLGLACFLFGYALHKRLVILTICLVGAVSLFAVLSGAADLLMNRGLSYRLGIWQDAWLRLNEVCGIWLGCGADDYRFLGQFFHAHSAYVAMLYRNGLLGAITLGLLAAMFFWRCSRARSRWMLLALFGWGSLITTGSGMLTSPQPYWVYFWLPTLMALLETQKEAVSEFLSAISKAQLASR